MKDSLEAPTFYNRFNLAVVARVAMSLSLFLWQYEDLCCGRLGDTNKRSRIGLVLFAAGAAVLVLVRNGNRLRQAFPAPLLLLLLYSLVAMVSAVYIPAYGYYTMWKGFEILADVFVIAAILSYPDAHVTARTAYLIIPFINGVLVIVYLVELLIMPQLALSPTRGYIPIYMHGVMPRMSENGLAFLSAVTALAVICRLYRPGRRVVKLCYLTMLCLALMTLLFAQSRTSVVGLALALVIYLLFDRRWLSLAVLAGVCLVAVTFTQATDVSSQYMLRGQDDELLTTLSGRTQGWEAAWQSFQDSPIVGQGFVSYARANILGTTGMSTLHGAVFDVLVGTGLLGLLPWIGAIGWTIARLIGLSASRHPWLRSALGRSIQAEMLGVMVLVIVRASTSSGLAMHEDNFMLWLTVLAYASSMSRILRHAPSGEKLTFARATRTTLRPDQAPA